MRIPLLIIFLFDHIYWTASRDEGSLTSTNDFSRAKCTRDEAGSECRPLESSTCLDVTLPYKYTLPSYFTNQSQIHDYLLRFTGLRKVPRCWTAFESIICTLFLPRCDAESQQSYRPTQDICRNAKNHCKIIGPFVNWLCNNRTLFPSSCENRYRDLKFLNPTATKCLSPILVPSEDSGIWFPGIEGCAYNCSDPRYSEADKHQLDTCIFYAALIGLVLTASACVTIHISKPIQAATAAIFYQCACISMVNFGFVFVKQFTEKENIVCRDDSSLRYSEPRSSNENRWLCICSFLFIYFFTIAAFVWRINLSLAFSQKFDLNNKSHNKKQSGGCKKTKATYHHMAAWSIPIMLIIIIICISEIDASFLIGICFVGFNSLLTRILFVLVPNALSVIVSCFFLTQCLLTLFQVRKTHSAPADEAGIRKDKKQRAKIRLLIAQISLIIVFEVAFLLIVIYANVFEYINSSAWNEDLKSSVICSLNVTDLSLPASEPIANSFSCPDRDGDPYHWGSTALALNKQASLKHVYLQLACVFVWSVVASSWTWRRESLQSWRRYLLQLLNAPNVEDQKLIRMHEIVAQAYATYKNNDRVDSAMSATKFNDPVGLNLTSVTSQEMSTSFVEGFVTNLMNSRAPATSSLSASKSKDRNHLNGQPKNKRYLKSLFKRKDKFADGSSISDVSVFRSNAANSSVAESMNLGSAGNSQLSLEDMRELQATIRHQRRKTRREHKQTLNRLATTRRGSETSTQSVAQSNRVQPLQTAARPATQQQRQHEAEDAQRQLPPPQSNLSPESLLQMQYNMLLHQAMSQQHPHSMPLSFNPFNCPPYQLQQPTLQPQPCLGPVELKQPQSRVKRIQPKIRPNLPNGAVDFSHGMTDQTESMKNPLTESRRPDSRIPYHQPNYNVVVQQAFNPMILNSSPFLNLMRNSNMMQPHQHLSPLSNFLMPNPSLASSNLSAATFNQFATVPGPTVETEAELQSLVRERAECIALVAPVDSGSEFGDSALPIAMSDSDAFYTDGETATVVSKASNSSNLMIQRAVTERMKHVEAQVAAVDSEEEEPNESNPLIGPENCKAAELDLNENNAVKESQVPNASANEAAVSSSQRPRSVEEPAARRAKAANKRSQKSKKKKDAKA